MAGFSGGCQPVKDDTVAAKPTHSPGLSNEEVVVVQRTDGQGPVLALCQHALVNVAIAAIDEKVDGHVVKVGDADATGVWQRVTIGPGLVRQTGPTAVGVCRPRLPGESGVWQWGTDEPVPSGRRGLVRLRVYTISGVEVPAGHTSSGP